jgi:hypothetical protein
MFYKRYVSHDYLLWWRQHIPVRKSWIYGKDIYGTNLDIHNELDAFPDNLQSVLFLPPVQRLGLTLTLPTIHRYNDNNLSESVKKLSERTNGGTYYYGNRNHDGGTFSAVHRTRILEQSKSQRNNHRSRQQQ